MQKYKTGQYSISITFLFIIYIFNCNIKILFKVETIQYIGAMELFTLSFIHLKNIVFSTFAFSPHIVLITISNKGFSI